MMMLTVVVVSRRGVEGMLSANTSRSLMRALVTPPLRIGSDRVAFENAPGLAIPPYSPTYHSA